MNDLLFYLPGTSDNLLFLTLVVLVLLIITGIYGYLSRQSNQRAEPSQKWHWGWPTLSLSTLAILFFWFGQPLSEEESSRSWQLITLISPFLTGMIVISTAAAAVLSSDLKWSCIAATVSFLTSGLLFLQTAALPLVLLCWLILGGSVFLFLHNGISQQNEQTDTVKEQPPFREPFLSCLVCGVLLCGCLWVVHREWEPESKHIPGSTQTPTANSTVMVQQLLTEHWPTFILLLVFVVVSFVVTSYLSSNKPTVQTVPDFTIQEE